MNKKYVWALIIVLVIIVIIGIVSSRSKNIASESTKIGVLLPLSGDFPWWGETIQNGIKVAEAKGLTKNIEFVYQDTKCNTKDAVSGTQSLKALYPTMHLFIVGCDNDLKAMLPILDKDKDAAFVLGLSGADLYESDVRVVNLAYRLEAEASAVAEFAYQKLGVKKIGIIFGNNTFGNVLSTSIPQDMTKLGGSAVSEEIQINDPHPETAVLKIVQSKPDAIYIHNDIPTIAAILKRLTQVGYKGPRIVTYAARDQSLIDGAGQAAEGMYVPWPVSDQLSVGAQDFVNTYKTMFGKDPFVTSYFAYDGLSLLNEASKNCDGSAKCQRDFHFEQIKNGKFVEI